ncbi:MAG: U32 family peptidase [Clostridia bacterium]
MIELLSPAGSMEKLHMAINYGANAVYFAGKQFGLRAFAGNFENDEIVEAVKLCHENNVKAYVTVNILARNSDFENLLKYIKFLENALVDGVIVADMGIISFIRQNAPKLDVHVSTQANVLNKYCAKFLADLGVKRIVLARELSLTEIKEIRAFLPSEVELECFVHGAMCISYSGRCLLSSYLAGRDSNRGACVQSCRWEYSITEKSRNGEKYDIEEDERGTYILNSKDLNMISHIRELEEAGVCSFKIEGRMKSPYYVACVTNAYRKSIDKVKENKDSKEFYDSMEKELTKTSHRKFTTAFYFGDKNKEERASSMPIQTHEFMAVVLEDNCNGKVLVEMRNRFEKGDTLEILSPSCIFNQNIVVDKMETLNGEVFEVAKNVQEKFYLHTSVPLKKFDILRKELPVLAPEK